MQPASVPLVEPLSLPLLLTQTEMIYARGVKDLLCNPRYVDAACVRDTMYTSLQLGLAGFTYGAQGSYYVR